MDIKGQAFVNRMRSPFKFGFYLLIKLPSAFFSGVRVREISETKSVVSVPYKWFSQNPFRSTYFACQAMAAEMSTGLLALAHIYGRTPAVSMLVVKMEAFYYKKATSRTWFTCVSGDLLKETIEKAVTSGEGQTVEVRSIGKNADGERISEFIITWSFKSKGVR